MTMSTLQSSHRINETTHLATTPFASGHCTSSTPIWSWERRSSTSFRLLLGDAPLLLLCGETGAAAAARAGGTGRCLPSNELSFIFM
jgi:hypothetical protein